MFARVYFTCQRIQYGVLSVEYDCRTEIRDKSSTEYYSELKNKVSDIQTSTKFTQVLWIFEASIRMEHFWSFSHVTLHTHKSCYTAALKLRKIVADARKNDGIVYYNI